MNFPETIEYLYSALPMFSRMGSAAFKKDLTNTRLLCEYLDNPHTKFRSVHVAGTNGKGSVSHMLAAVFQTAGYKTGLYTSPHLYDFRERIKINGEMVEEEFVIDFVERIKPMIEKIEPSFFEITVAMAFEYFASKKVEIAIIETGLGGRLDSTNIINPELSVITNIGWDHMNMLGNTLEEIAFEKAGIIKENKPVVIGEKRPETDQVFIDNAIKKSAPVFFAQDYFIVQNAVSDGDVIRLTIVDNNAARSLGYECDLPGLYQSKNIVTVLEALHLLKGFHFSEDTIQTALKNTRRLTGLAGRWQRIYRKPDIILEVAHNKDGIEQMLAHLRAISYQQLHLVIGMVKDKDVEQVLRILPREAVYYFTQANSPRAMDATELYKKASVFSLEGTVHANVNEALNEARKAAAEEDLVIVCGSIFLVAEVDVKNFIQ